VDGRDANHIDTNDRRDLALIFARATVHRDLDTGKDVKSKLS